MLCAQIHECLCEIMKRLRRLAFHYGYLTFYFRERTSDGLVFGLVFYQLAVVHQRVLTEEIAVLLGSLLEEGRIVGHSYPNLIPNNGAIATFAQAATERLSLQDKRTYNLLIIGSHVSCLEEKDKVFRMLNGSHTNAQTRRRAERHIDRKRDIVDRDLMQGCTAGLDSV